MKLLRPLNRPDSYNAGWNVAGSTIDLIVVCCVVQCNPDAGGRSGKMQDDVPAKGFE